jgi:hypothetical protein
MAGWDGASSVLEQTVLNLMNDALVRVRLFELSGLLAFSGTDRCISFYCCIFSDGMAFFWHGASFAAWTQTVPALDNA